LRAWAEIEVLGERAGWFKPRCLAELSSQLAIFASAPEGQLWDLLMGFRIRMYVLADDV